MNIIALVGSLRKDSINRKLLQVLTARAPSHIVVTEVNIDLPLFNADLDRASLYQVLFLQKSITESDGVLIVSPEYNRSFPGALKNALDWTDDVLSGKAVAVAGATEGSLGTALMQASLKQVLLHMNCKLFGSPEFQLGTFSKKIDSEGKIIDERTEKLVKSFWESFMKIM